MVVVAVSIDTNLYERVATRVREGKYLSLEQFFEVAAQNQLALEDSNRRQSRGGRLEATEVAENMDRRRGGTPRDGKGSESSAPHEADVSDTDWRSFVRRRELPADVFAEAEIVTETECVLWGQTNRLLPVAVGVRVLANLLNDHVDVPVARWHEESTRVAMLLREELREQDERAGRPHGTRWATAFPERKPASAQRYVNQFLGAPARDRRSDGGAVFLGLVTLSGTGEDARVSLTRSGAEWASFTNPIFDANGDEPASTFSEDETRFFLNHLRGFRIGEYRFLNTVAALVAEGLSREQLNDALTLAYPQWEGYASTMRAGAIGRLSDLGLLERTRHGLNVDYRLSPLASEVGLPELAQVVEA